MDKFFYPEYTVPCFIKRPSECGKRYFLTELNLTIFNNFGKIYTYSTSLHQDSYLKNFNVLVTKNL